MAEITWAKDVSGSFSTASYWAGGKVPGASDNAILASDGGAPYTVSSGSVETVDSLQTASNATLALSGDRETFTMTDGTGVGVNAGTVDITGAATLIAGGVLDNTGLISAYGTTTEGFSQLSAASMGLTLTGFGTIALTGAHAGIEGGALYNVNNLIEGGVDLSTSYLDNGPGGLIENTQGDGFYGDINGGDGGIRNAGTLANIAADSGIAIAEHTILNAGGTILATNDSTVSLIGVVDGGEIEASAGGYMAAGTYVYPGQTIPTVLDGSSTSLTIVGTVTVRKGYKTNLEGRITNNGAISVESADNKNTFLDVEASGATLSGAGSIELSNEAKNYMFASGAGAVLTNVNNTLSGSGTIGGDGLEVANESAGVIDASGTVELLLTTTTGVTNDGQIEATGEGGLVIRATTIANEGGVISAGAGSKVTLQTTDIVGGTLFSAGDGAIRINGAGNTIDGSSSAVDVTGELIVLTGGSLTGEGTIDLSGKLISKDSATLGGPLTNTGALETAGGSITVTGAVTGAGEAIIIGGTMSFGSAFSQKVVFKGAGTLALGDSQDYAGLVIGFSTTGTDALDLQDIAFTGATESYSGTTGGGVLTVISGAEVAHISLKGDYLGTTFTLSKDANGGTIITGATPESPAVATIAQAIAAFAPAQADSAGVAHETARSLPILARPGGAF